MKLKSFIKYIIPYGLICIIRKWGESKTSTQPVSPSNLFMQEFKEYIHSENKVQYDSESKFRYIVSVQGYGRTGSSAIVDILREYSSVTVLGYVDPYYSKATSNKLTDEVAYIRDSGGFADIEKYIGSQNRFLQDAVLHRFIRLITRRNIYVECPKIRPYIYQFLSDIAKIQSPTPDQRYYNPHLDYDGNCDILSLKPITLDQYRNLTKSLLISIFNTFHTKGKDVLVLDQFFLDTDYTEKEKLMILPNIKTITSVRDPRDVYSFINKTNVMWIPHDNPREFIEWYKDRNINITNDCRTKKTIRFENLFENYDNTISDIEGFLDIESSSHIHKFSCFDPIVSKEGYMTWKQDKKQKEAYFLIQKELEYLCYPTDESV